MAEALTTDRRMTVAEFADWHDGTDARHELVRGAPVAMAPPSVRHGDIASNILIGLAAQLRRPCRAAAGTGVARSADDEQCRIPDVVVSCEPASGPVFLEPRLIVEVLSPSTEKEDRTTKLDFYKSLPSVAAILLVWRDERRVQLHTREGPRWPAQDFIGSAAVPLADLAAGIGLDDVYAGVDPPPGPRDETDPS